MKKIILLGYMGSGKTTIASKVADVLKKKHLDLDKLIEKKEGKTINSIFATKGEIYFRKIEHEVFKDLMESQDDFVLSFGGGTPCYANNHLFLKEKEVISIYLKTSVEELSKRLLQSKAERPLIAQMNEDELKEFIAKHLFDRSYYYHQAQHFISTDNKLEKEVVQEIIKLLT
ncbi:MAG TPA: shikimate kinase [Flavobacterium sp.]|jgi:shikimate kinase|nr:shikimate kinase [Flavobacterium sp.]HQV35875.1 shikimate kinase [Flavobacterium sp.]HQX03740.1 shikimate kinase [Flavobacterium sp.]HRZ31719.1 shikimate kinase [Flavobacterium sp.]HRZ74367.1 shikimate kinase [Flavobacterium sp.]